MHAATAIAATIYSCQSICVFSRPIIFRAARIALRTARRGDRRSRPAPGQQRVVNGGSYGPFPAGFGSDGRNRGDAGEVEQDEDQEGRGRCGREIAAGAQSGRKRRVVRSFEQFDGRSAVFIRIGDVDRRRGVRTADDRSLRNRRCGRFFGVEYADGAYDDLFGRDARKKRHAGFPIESQRRENRFAPFAQASEVGVFVMRDAVRVGSVGSGKIAQQPHDDRCHEDHAAHFAQILCAFIPHVRQRGFPRRQPVGRQFHDEGRFVDRKEEAPQQPRRNHGDDDT